MTKRIATCQHCGKEFVPKHGHPLTRAKFCSRACVGGSQRKKHGPHVLEQIETLTARGVSLRSIAAAVGLPLSALNRAKGRSAEIEEAIERGRAREHDDLVGALYRRAMDLSCAQGAASAMFLLKCRHGYREVAETPSGNQLAVVVSVPAALDPAKYEQLVRRADPKLLADRQETIDAEVIDAS